MKQVKKTRALKVSIYLTIKAATSKCSIQMKSELEQGEFTLDAPNTCTDSTSSSWSQFSSTNTRRTCKKRVSNSSTYLWKMVVKSNWSLPLRVSTTMILEKMASKWFISKKINKMMVRTLTMAWVSRVASKLTRMLVSPTSLVNSPKRRDVFKPPDLR